MSERLQRNESDKKARAWWKAIDQAAKSAPRLVDKTPREPKPRTRRKDRGSAPVEFRAK